MSTATLAIRQEVHRLTGQHSITAAAAALDPPVSTIRGPKDAREAGYMRAWLKSIGRVPGYPEPAGGWDDLAAILGLRRSIPVGSVAGVSRAGSRGIPVASRLGPGYNRRSRVIPSQARDRREAF